MANPKAGGESDPDVLRAALEKLGATVVDAAPDRIVVAGGDGSVGHAAARAAQLEVPLAVIPAGTANDFVRALRPPRGAAEAPARPVRVLGRRARRGPARAAAAVRGGRRLRRARLAGHRRL